VEAFRIELEQGVAAHLIGPGAARLTEIEARAKRRFFLEGKPGVALDHFKVKAEGKLVDIAPKAPVEEGAEIRLDLVEVGEHDMAAGVGKLDGLSICVADASQLIGKKAKIRVERVLDGMAYATLVQPVTKSAGLAPITAEAEAEKPTRAPRKKKADEPQDKPGAETAVADEPVLDEPVADEPVAEEAVAGETAAEEPAAEEPATTDGEAPKPKKKTRRGSRGGRNRKKKPAVADADADAATATAAAENGQPEPAAEPAGNGKPTPKAEPAPKVEPTPVAATIHVPSADLGADGENTTAEGEQPPKKKRTRRGSRGGRNRRKKPAGAATEAPPETPPE
jgi:predicted RNA-binding protein with TRAM domain